MNEIHSVLFCTNAFNLSYDKNGNEIYGIFELIDIFRNFPQFGLIFSDPSNAYSSAFKTQDIEIPNNVYIITGTHSFYKVMELSDATIRNTTTDGDSLSVRESLYLKKWTFVTDVVSRPKGSILYKKEELKNLLSEFNFSNEKRNDVTVENGFLRLKKIYNNCLIKN
jgi:hypothetical protein